MNSNLSLRVLLFLFFLSSSFWGNAQQDLSPQFYLDSIFHLAKETSVVRNEVNWTAIKKEYDRLSINAKTEKDIIPAVKFLLKSLGDFHGRIWVDQVPHNGVVKDFVESNFELPPDLLREYQYGKIPFSGKMVQKKYGYLMIPGIMMSDQDESNAQKIKALVCNLQKEHHPEAWILDLRLNGGGTMFPMLSGLSPFLGEDTIGYFLNPATGYQDSWHLKNGNFNFSDYQYTNYEMKIDGCENIDLEKTKVAVLVSASTSSSGEVTTLAFRNRDNTILIGENTAGYTTGVSWNTLSDKVVMQIAQNYYADRKKNMYKGTSILPDIHVRGGEDLDNLDQDKMVQAAINWIEKK